MEIIVGIQFIDEVITFHYNFNTHAIYAFDMCNCTAIALAWALLFNCHYISLFYYITTIHTCRMFSPVCYIT